MGLLRELFRGWREGRGHHTHRALMIDSDGVWTFEECICEARRTWEGPWAVRAPVPDGWPAPGEAWTDKPASGWGRVRTTYVDRREMR